MGAFVAAIIPAAGAGTRLAGAGNDARPPKALRELSGRSLLQRSVDALAPYVDEIVVAAPPSSLDMLGLEPAGAADLVVVAGGATRQESVRNALAMLGGRVAWVLVHDAARPLVPGVVVQRVLDALGDGAQCVVPVIVAPDSCRQLRADGTNMPLARDRVRLVQTPQGFSLAALRRGHSRAVDDQATDDATLVEAAGSAVVLVEGDPRAFKITTALDLTFAEALLAPG